MTLPDARRVRTSENSTDSKEFQVTSLCFFSRELVAQPELFGLFFFLITCTLSPGTDANLYNQSERFYPKERLMGPLQTSKEEMRQ